MSTDLPVHACDMRLLLSGLSVSLLPDRRSGNEFIEIPLDNLEELTVGSAVRNGWIGISAKHEEFEVSYQTAEAREVQEFVRSLRRRWLGLPITAAKSKHSAWGAALVGKFAALLAEELDPNEQVLAQYFDSAAALSRRGWLRQRPSWTPSHLLAVTSARRLVWITDHHALRGERVANIRRTVPLARLTAINMADADGERMLRIRCGRTHGWNVPVRPATESSVDNFLRAVAGCLS